MMSAESTEIFIWHEATARQREKLIQTVQTDTLSLLSYALFLDT